jgi:replicative DNA helicase
MIADVLSGDQNAEHAVINAVFINNTLYDEIEITLEDFTYWEYRELWKAMSEIIEKGDVTDKRILFHKINTGDLKVELATVADLVPYQVENFSMYVEKLKEETDRRNLFKLLTDGLELLNGKPKDIIQILNNGLASISDHSVTTMMPIENLIKPTIDEIEETRNRESAYSGLESGYSELDDFTDGFHAGELIIVAARTSIGKTAFALNITQNMIVDKKYKVGFFSLEMNYKEIIKRLISSTGRVGHDRVRSGMLSEKDFVLLTEAASKIHDTQLWIDDTFNIRLSELLGKARQLKRKGAQIIFIDYLTLIKYESPHMQRIERIGEISKSLKHLARELHIPIVVMSQLNRLSEGKRPNTSELRQSGEIEEDADVILLLHRNRKDTHTEIIIGKNRNGALGTVHLEFLPQYTRFEQSVALTGNKQGGM